eukprot:2117889-Alexandrium_andersonii.AAC.2
MVPPLVSHQSCAELCSQRGDNKTLPPVHPRPRLEDAGRFDARVGRVPVPTLPADASTTTALPRGMPIA